MSEFFGGLSLKFTFGSAAPPPPIICQSKAEEHSQIPEDKTEEKKIKLHSGGDDLTMSRPGCSELAP